MTLGIIYIRALVAPDAFRLRLLCQLARCVAVARLFGDLAISLFIFCVMTMLIARRVGRSQRARASRVWRF